MKAIKNSKIILVICFVVMNISVASAQFNLGFKGGIDLADGKIKSDMLEANNRLGFQLGVTTEVMLPLVGFGVQADVLYGYKQFDIEKSDRTGNISVNDISDYNYFMIPVNLKKKFSALGLFGIYLIGGPYAKVKLSGGDIKLTDGNSLDTKSSIIGLNFGAGVTLVKKLELGMTYRFDLSDNYDETLPNFKNQKDKSWNLNLTYFFY